MKVSCLDNFLDLKSNQIPIVTGQHMLFVHIIHYLCVSNFFSCSSYYVDDDDDGCLFIALFSAVEQIHCRSRFFSMHLFPSCYNVFIATFFQCMFIVFTCTCLHVLPICSLILHHVLIFIFF